LSPRGSGKSAKPARRGPAAQAQRTAAARPTTARPTAGGPRSGSSRVNPAVRRALRGESVSHAPFFAFGPINYALMAGGLVAAGLGFVLLGRGDISFAPVLIVVGYCALIPLGIEWRSRPRKRGSTGE